MNQCFECGSTTDLHNHHVVPRTLGGTKTITLCGRCHGLVHSRDMTHHATLTKKALEDKRAQGRRTSKDAPYGFRIDTDNDTLVADEHEQRVLGLVRSWRAAGVSIRGIVLQLTAEGVHPRGGRWHPTTINRMLNR